VSSYVTVDLKIEVNFGEFELVLRLAGGESDRRAQD
jgi:hypothetical protein